MTNIEKIRKRIEKRKRKVDLFQEVKSLENKNKSNNLYKIMMGIMTVFALFMSFAIYAKKDSNGVYINSILNTNFNFTSFNKSLNNLINFKIVEDSNNPIQDMVVSSNVNYINVGDDFYTSEGNLAVSMDNGVITYVNGKDDYYTVIVEYDSGVRATYNGINEVNVYVNDRVYRDDILGSFNEKVEIIFIKNSEKISYEEVISII